MSKTHDRKCKRCGKRAIIGTTETWRDNYCARHIIETNLAAARLAGGASEGKE
jgi:hypothetical protein